MSSTTGKGLMLRAYPESQVVGDSKSQDAPERPEFWNVDATPERVKF